MVTLYISYFSAFFFAAFLSVLYIIIYHFLLKKKVLGIDQNSPKNKPINFVTNNEEVEDDGKDELIITKSIHTSIYTPETQQQQEEEDDMFSNVILNSLNNFPTEEVNENKETLKSETIETSFSLKPTTANDELRDLFQLYEIEYKQENIHQMLDFLTPQYYDYEKIEYIMDLLKESEIFDNNPIPNNELNDIIKLIKIKNI